MNRLTRNALKADQRGSGHLVLIAAVLIIGMIGFAGWRVYDANRSVTPAATATTSAAAAVPATLKSTADLDAASKAVSQTNVDNDLNTSSLDGDMNAVL